MPEHIASQLKDQIHTVALKTENNQLTEEELEKNAQPFSLLTQNYKSYEALQNASYLTAESKKLLKNGKDVEGDTSTKDTYYIYKTTIDGKEQYLQILLKQSLFSDSLKNAFLLLSIITFLIGIILNIMSSIEIASPIKKLTLYTKQISKGDFSFKIKNIDNKSFLANIRVPKEIQLLYTSFEKMSTDLENMLKSQKDFISNISHEYQTPLTSINGFSIALQQKEMTKEQQIQYLQIIEHESARLSQLSKNVLKLSSLQNNTQILEKKQFNLAEQIRLAIISLEPLYSKKDITVNLDAENGLIFADELLLYQVWYNLLNNAINFTPKDGTINIRLEEHYETFTILIEDSGPGIDQLEINRVKEPFYKSKKNASSGNGLGLSIVENIILKHGGQFHLMNYEHGLRVKVKLFKDNH